VRRPWKPSISRNQLCISSATIVARSIGWSPVLMRVTRACMILLARRNGVRFYVGTSGLRPEPDGAQPHREGGGSDPCGEHRELHLVQQVRAFRRQDAEKNR